ncbi:MAG: MG2 domain-containing protein [Saprospiraceae bacterium]
MFFVFFLAESCSKLTKNEAYYLAISKYVYAYSSGAVGRTDAIRVRFINPAVGSDQVGQKVAGNLFSVSPSIPGDAVWEDDRTILLQPTEPLPYGEKYTGTVALGKLFSGVPKEAKVFEFEFSVRELSFEVVAFGLRTQDASNLRVQQLTGHILTSDPVENASVEKMLQAKQGNKTLSIGWVHKENNTIHEFYVNDVERGNVRSSVQLSWSGEPIGLDKQGNLEQMVPALDEFVVLSAVVSQKESQHVVLNFSDPILPTQDLNGLIRLEEYDGTLNFAIDGNFVRAYLSNRVIGEKNLRVEAGIKNVAGATMKERSDWPLVFEDLKPAVRLVGRGAVIPQNSDGSVIFPFEAVGLKAVDVEVFKIYNSNILQYLQVNEMEDDQELERVGKIILQKKIALSDLNPNASSAAWQHYALDLKDIIQQDPGAIYQIRLAFRRGYATYNCNATSESDGSNNQESKIDDEEDGMAHLGATDENGNLSSILGGYRGIYYSDYDYDEGEWYEGDDEGDYNWSNRDNPCRREYYNYQRFVQRNVFVSDLGITAKRGKDQSLFVAVTDLHTTEPVSGVQVELYSYQLQSITKASTGSDGTAIIEDVREVPFVVVASNGDRRGYLRMADGNSLSLSRFDVAGVEAQRGLKGYLYGERGVWRPGDSLFLNFVLEDKLGNLPQNHPVTLELTDPRGALQFRTVSAQSTGGVYPLHCATRPDAPTGNWTAKVQVGGATFTKQLKIETVKPNRLKLELDFGKKELSNDDKNLNGKLSVKWLHGAVAKDLKAKVELQMRAAKTEFANYKDFVFDDPTRSFSSDPQVLLDGSIDGNGQANVPLQLGDHDQAPGKLIANFRIRVFEKSGDFSTDNFALDFFPYDRFVGVSIPVNRWGSKEIDRIGGEIQFAVVDKNGRPQPNKKIEVGLYRCDWRWWWDEDASSDVAQFNSAEHVNAVDKTTLTTDGRGMAKWKVKPGNWGRFLVRAVDPDGGHAGGDFFWTGYPDQLDDIKSRNAAAMLAFSVEKEKYAVGEEVTIKVPASENGRILLTLENGMRVAQHLWFDAKTGDNILKFKASEEMAPTVYAHVSLLQPHAQTKNDLPIRMYGVMPVSIENPQTHLQPKLEMPEVLKPGEPFTVSVSESSGKACAYTLAIVDEGLLDLTRFETPNPWDAFYAREALGVKTWDIYDYVLGAYGAELERILAVGGDGINQKAKNAAQVNRFKPAVVHVGPFYLEKGKTAKHTLKLDNYVGSVRAMLVCSAPAPGSKGAYGMAEKTCPVRKPLMILPTLPRVLGPGESLKLPVDVFAMENKVKNATVQVREKSGLVSVQGGGSNSLNFSQPGEQMTYFDLKVGNKTGAAKFTISAQGGGESVSQDIEILVRNPNPVVSTVWEGIVEPGQEWSQSFDPGQFTDISSAVLEVSALPAINLSRHLEYLIQYPHGCVEQTVSGAFPQLYVDLLTPLSEKQKAEIDRNVKAAVEKLRNFQQAGGGFSYWPGMADVNDWSSTYAGHFLLEAKNKGYAIPANVLEKWVGYQTVTSRQWNGGGNDQYYYHDDLTQAYRLYTLALAGKPDLAGMNRLREKKDQYSQSAYLLAAAYAQSGKPEVAKEIIAAKWRDDWRYDWSGYTYGSDLRDRALILETYTAIGDVGRAQTMANFVCAELGKENGWYWNTQSIATSLRALSKYVSKNFREGTAFAYRINGGNFKNGDSSKPISTVNFTGEGSKVAVKNNSAAKMYARLIVNARPVVGEENATASNIAMSIRYTDTKGNPLDIGKLTQGTDFVAEVTVKRNSQFGFPFEDLALSQTFPSGWEILNARMNGVNGVANSPSDYQDIRDDRVYTYFDLPNVYRQNQPDTRVYRIQLNAAYSGRYYLPTVACEAMYDNRIRATVPGRWVEVI